MINELFGYEAALAFAHKGGVSGTVAVHYAGSTNRVGVGVFKLLSAFSGCVEARESDFHHPHTDHWDSAQQRQNWLDELKNANLIRRTSDGTYVLTATARVAQYEFCRSQNGKDRGLYSSIVRNLVGDELADLLERDLSDKTLWGEYCEVTKPRTGQIKLPVQGYLETKLIDPTSGHR